MRRRGPDVPEHELDAPRPSEMKFDALSSEPTNSSRGALSDAAPRLQTARRLGSRSCVATKSTGAASDQRFCLGAERRRHGRRPAHQRDRSRRTRRRSRRRAKTGPSKGPRAHSRKRECRSRLLRRAPGADGLPECEPPPTTFEAPPITVAMPGRVLWKLRR